MTDSDGFLRLKRDLFQNPIHYKKLGPAYRFFLNSLDIALVKAHWGEGPCVEITAKTNAEWAEEFDVNEKTIRRWKKRIALNKYAEIIPGKTTDTIIINVEDFKAKTKDEPNKPDLSAENEYPESRVNGKTKIPAKKDISDCVHHLHAERERLHGIKPTLNNNDRKVMAALLKTETTETVKIYTTKFFSLNDKRLKEQGFPIAFLPYHLDKIKMLGKSEGTEGHRPPAW